VADDQGGKMSTAPPGTLNDTHEQPAGDAPNFEPHVDVHGVDNSAGKGAEEAGGAGAGASALETAEGTSAPEQVQAKGLVRVSSEDEVDGLVGGGGDGDAAGSADKSNEGSAAPAPDGAPAKQDANPEAADAAGGTDPDVTRADTPVSRTSTPPLANSTPGSISVPKKFSSVNATKKFLSKTVANPSASPAAASKLAPGMSVRTYPLHPTSANA
jgi:hypothetical protein